MNQLKEFLNIETRTKYFLHTLLILCLVSLSIFGLLLLNQGSLNKEQPLPVENRIDPFAHLYLEARAAVVWDVVNQRELFSKNPDLPLPLASLTKVMTALTTEEKLNDTSWVRITPEYLVPEGDSELVVGDTWRLVDLRDFTLLTSSNDGALALAGAAGTESSFITSMNEAATIIGLTNSRFWNEHGLDQDEKRSGSYGSANDMAILFEYILKNYPDLLEATRYKNLAFRSAANVYLAENTNDFIDQIPGILASKTGFTDLAGGNLVVAFDPGLNRPIIVVVLGSSEEGRFGDVLKLVNATMKYIDSF